MIRIFLGKRQVEDYVDYPFLEIENNNVEYIVKSPTEKDTYEFFDNLEPGSIFVDSELVLKNPSLEQIESIDLTLKTIQPIADELKKSYKPAKVINTDNDSIEIFRVPSPSQFKHWMYITASDLLNRFLFKYKCPQGKKREYLASIMNFLGKKNEEKNKERKR